MGKKVGAEYLENGDCLFRVWCPSAETVEVIFKDKRDPLSLKNDAGGYWEGTEKIPPDSFYKIRLNGQKEFPDPASRSQPEGVHSWSCVSDPFSYLWNDTQRKHRRLGDMVIYELHVGTFTEQGTFEAVIGKLDHLATLGVNTLELMPVAQFPGARNWGYDGVYPFAPQVSYGGANGLKKLIDTCHQKGFSILLDVVYNHIGPEGNYLPEFGPYFTSKYHTPWGKAINFDDEYSEPVRNFFIQNALMWLEEFHLDGLRLDAVHEIIDRGAHHFLKELSEQVDRLEERTGRKYVLIAESDLNDSRIVTDYRHGGYGLEGQWVDDFHHAVHTVMTRENAGYYQDYGKMKYLAKSFRQGFIYDGMYSKFRKRRVGNSPGGISKKQLVCCIQNHDQVGNRLLGERIASLVNFEQQKLAAGILLSAPFVPLLFMGEEYGETNPFRYFVSHDDPELVRAVREGRKKEFEYFHHNEGVFPDPQSPETFQESKLNWNSRNDEKRTLLYQYYTEMIRLRKEGAFSPFCNDQVETDYNEETKVLKVAAKGEKNLIRGVYNFGSEPLIIDISEGLHPEILVASSDRRWGGEKDFESRIFSRLEVPQGSLLIYKINS